MRSHSKGSGWDVCVWSGGELVCFYEWSESEDAQSAENTTLPVGKLGLIFFTAIDGIIGKSVILSKGE